MRAGVLILQDAPWAQLRARAAGADEMGFDTVWVADHVAEPYRPGVPWSEAWTLLGALAVTCRHATVGALTSSLTLRNPALLVLAAQTLHDISGGRAELALGAGGAPLDHELTGIPAWSPSERAERFAEFVPAVARMLKEAGPGPAGAPRLTVGALGPRSITLAARHADAWNSYGVPTGKRLTTRLTHEEALALFRERARRLEHACVEAGRDPATVGKSYTWVESYAEPELLDVATCTRVARDFRNSGADEFVLYWPADDSQAERLGDIVRALHEL